MSIGKSEKYVAVTKTYVQRTRRESDYRSLRSSTSLIAIRGLARESYPVAYELAGWISAPAIGWVDRRWGVVIPENALRAQWFESHLSKLPGTPVAGLKEPYIDSFLPISGLRHFRGTA